MGDSNQTLTVYVDRDDRFTEPVKVRDFNHRKYPTVNSLLDTLIAKVDGLPYGPRLLTTAGGETRITKVTDIEVGKTYICTDKSKVSRIDKTLMEMRKQPPRFQFGQPKPPPTAPKLYWDMDKQRQASKKWPTGGSSSEDSDERDSYNKSDRRHPVRRTNSAPTSSHGILKSKRTLPQMTPSTAHRRVELRSGETSPAERRHSPRKRQDRRSSSASGRLETPKRNRRRRDLSPRPPSSTLSIQSEHSDDESAATFPTRTDRRQSTPSKSGSSDTKTTLAPLDKRRLPPEQRKNSKNRNRDKSPRRDRRARVANVGAAPGGDGHAGNNNQSPRKRKPYSASMNSVTQPYEIAYSNIESVVDNLRRKHGNRTPPGELVAPDLEFLAHYMHDGIDLKIREMWAQCLVDVGAVGVLAAWMDTKDKVLREGLLHIFQLGATCNTAFVTQLQEEGVIARMMELLRHCKCRT